MVILYIPYGSGYGFKRERGVRTISVKDLKYVHRERKGKMRWEEKEC